MRESTSKYTKQLSEYFKHSENISLVCHTNPDGDAIGSMMALYHYLVSRGKNCNIFSPTAIPSFLEWLEDCNNIIIYHPGSKTTEELLLKSDLLVMLDFNNTGRLGEMEDQAGAFTGSRVLIDHHPDPDVEAELVISEPGLSSTAELVYYLVDDLSSGTYMEMPFMEAVYTGMMTDTGNFSFGTYNGESLRAVARMLDYGLDKDRITDLVYDNFSADRMRLMGFALSERMVVIAEYSTAYIYLSKADLERHNHRVGDTEGFVNLPLSVDGIKFSVLFIEKDNHIKLSLRSKGDIAVNRISSQYFEGGGHLNAAGGRYDASLEETLRFFESILPGLFENNNYDE